MPGLGPRARLQKAGLGERAEDKNDKKSFQSQQCCEQRAEPAREIKTGKKERISGA